MILSFKDKFPWDEPTFFIYKILACVLKAYSHAFVAKKHTIRKYKDPERIKAGTVIQMATGVRTKEYYQFNKNVPELSVCKSTQRIDITYRANNVVAIYIDKKLKFCRNREHIFEVTPGWMETFVKNDGFRDEVHFFMWFTKSVRNGCLIHWTDLKY